MDYDKIGLLIADLRKEKGLTQKDVADKLGITDRAVSKWERGLGCPDISLLDDLSRVLDISILEILKGRRLDKDEIVNNESLIESMNYSKENLKYKFKRYFNLAVAFIIALISLVLIISNLKSIYYLNKTYHSIPFNNLDIKVFAEIESNIERIKNNKGIYSEDDYKKILVIVNALENSLKEQNNLYYLNKNTYTYSEIVEFYKYHQDIYLGTSVSEDIEAVYEIVHNYDPSVVNNLVSYQMYSRSLIEIDSDLFQQIIAPYYNEKNVRNELVISIQSHIYIENVRDDMLLKDIIKVGDINE